MHIPVKNALFLAFLSAFFALSANVSAAATVAEKNETTMTTVINCPDKCTCYGATSLLCSNLTAAQISEIFDERSDFARNLQNLTIRHSELYDFVPITAFLIKCSRLLFLDLSHNQINQTTMATTVSTMGTAVMTLDLSYNKLAAINRDAFVLFPLVEEIRVKNNGIFSVQWEAFRLFQLKRLVLSYNHLATINEYMLRFTPNLEYLDLSHNQLSLAQSSSFFAAQRLAQIDLSHNRIQRFRYDSFAPLFQLESFNLAFNNLSQIPADLRQFIALRQLNLSGNPFEKICVGDLDQPVLQVLDVSSCPRLKLIEANAFTKLPNLQTAILSNNSALAFVSPRAFYAVNMLFELDLSKNSLMVLNESIIRLPTRIHLSGNPFECECVAPLARRYAQHVVDAKDATCLPPTSTRSDSARKTSTRLPLLDWTAGSAEWNSACLGGEPLLPFGANLSAQVGDFYSLYCAPRNSTDTILWTLPNGTQFIASQTEMTPISTAQSRSLFGPSFGGDDLSKPFVTSASMHFPLVHYAANGVAQTQQQPQQKAQLPKRWRILVTKEQLRFEVLTEEDKGDYRCKVIPAQQAEASLAPEQPGEERVLHLRVARPSIDLSVAEMGSHYASLVWNASLRIRAIDKVTLSLDVRDADGQLGRSIQLSLYNPWYSYNVMRLKPLNNYTFCLAYRLLDYDVIAAKDRDREMAAHASGFATLFGVSSPSADAIITNRGRADSRYRTPLFEACVSAQTTENLGFWRSLNTSTVVTLAVVFFLIFALMTARAIYLRFYIWHETKLRARMNESVSGQSFLSNSSSVHNAVNVSHSITFENKQVLNQMKMISVHGGYGPSGSNSFDKHCRNASNNNKNNAKCTTNGALAKRNNGSLASRSTTTTTKIMKAPTKSNGIGETSRMLNFDDIAV